ncbi:uncharacterized membrane protein YhaH (DUF805 family) [Bradyrhizobium sp. AZCC 1678]
MHSIFAWYFLSLTGRIKCQEFALGCFGLLAMCGVLTRLLTEVAFFNTAGRNWRYEDLMVALSLPFLFAFHPDLAVRRDHGQAIARSQSVWLVGAPRAGNPVCRKADRCEPRDIAADGFCAPGFAAGIIRQ